MAIGLHNKSTDRHSLEKDYVLLPTPEKLHCVSGRQVFDECGRDGVCGLRRRQVLDGLGRFYMPQLRRQHVLWSYGRYIGEYLSGMSGELTVCRRIDSTGQLRVQSGFHGAQRRPVLGV